MNVSKTQAEYLLASYLNVYKLTQGMRKKIGKSFAIDGRLLGDIGECVLAYAFNLELNDKQKPGFDAKTNEGELVEIKIRTNNNHLHISDATVKNLINNQVCFLLVAEIDIENRKIVVIENGLLKASIQGARSNGFITRKNLKKHCDSSEKKLMLKHKKISNWEIK